MDPLEKALRGENPMVMTRLPSGFVVIGDTQHLPGYCVLLCDDPEVSHLSDLDWPRRKTFLFDLSLVGESIVNVCRGDGLRRVNYEVLGNSLPLLHGHVHPRYDWEPPARITGPVWRYPREERNDPAHAYEDGRHGALRARLTSELERLAALAY